MMYLMVSTSSQHQPKWFFVSCSHGTSAVSSLSRVLHKGTVYINHICQRPSSHVALIFKVDELPDSCLLIVQSCMVNIYSTLPDAAASRP